MKLISRLGLNFRAGDWVEVKSIDEILATLDENGRLEALPFMPEMLQYCGKKFRIYKSAHKTCDTIKESRNRSMRAAVHLDGLRCDGSAHGGCQAKCLLFWKEAWIKPVGAGTARDETAQTLSVEKANRISSRCDLVTLGRSVVASDGDSYQHVRYSCQATELRLATSSLPWWQPVQYLKDLVSRNVSPRHFLRYITIATFNAGMRSYSFLVTKVFSYSPMQKLIGMVQTRQGTGIGGAEHENVSTFETAWALPTINMQVEGNADPIKTPIPKRSALPHRLARKIYGVGKQLNSHLHRYPYIQGLASDKTPTQKLDLQPGEWVQVRAIDEIRPTINRGRRNRGLKFDVEMVPYCGGTFRVLDRVERIINEQTGKMMRLPNECVILDGVTCSGCFSQNRLFCPRSIYPYWREIWLKRVESNRSTESLTNSLSS